MDEIGEMPIDMQVSLLRFLQDKKITRLGGNTAKKVDVRIIAATNKILEEAIADGTFRDDLYHRLNVVNIVMPPLRQRQDDIPLLTGFILEKLCEEYQITSPIMERDILEAMKSYPWPGNVRELYNILENMLLTCGWDGIIDTLLDRSLQNEDRLNTPINIRDYERQAIMNTLNSCNGNISQAAKVLGINRNTLYKIIELFQLEASPAARVFQSKMQ